MSRRTRPNTADERVAGVRAGRALRAELPPAARVGYAPAPAAYTRAVRRYAAAQAREERARARVHAAAEVFEVAFRGWAGTVVDEKKRRASARLAELLGGLVPGRLPLCAPAEQLSRTADLRAHIAADPSLRRVEARRPGSRRFTWAIARRAEALGVPTCWKRAREPQMIRWEAQVRAALDARHVLAAAVAARSAAEVRRVRSRSALDRAERAFDLAWGALVRAIQDDTPALTSKLPNFAT